MGSCWSHAAIRKQDEEIERVTTFVRFAMLGDLGNLKLMLAKDKLDPNACDRFGMTALHWACYNGKLACVQELLQAGASTKAVDQNGRNALHHACRKDQDDVVRYLIQVEKMDTNSTSENKDTPLHKAGTSVAVLRGKGIKSIEVLLQNGADPYRCNDQNRTPLEELDSSPGTVTDVMAGEMSTARVNAEIEALRQDFHTQDNHHTKQQQRTRSMPFANRSSDLTLITKFGASIREFSEHQSSDNALSSRTSSAHNLGAIGGGGGTSVWARLTGGTGTSSGKNSARIGVSFTPVELAPLDLERLNARLNVSHPTTPSASSSSTSTTPHSATQRASAHEVVPGRKSLKYAGKRVIMALRVKKHMPVDEKREMIRLLLKKHMQRENSSGVSSDAVTVQQSRLQHHLSELTLSLPPDN